MKECPNCYSKDVELIGNLIECWTCQYISYHIPEMDGGRDMARAAYFHHSTLKNPSPKDLMEALEW